ncbi:carbamoyltransferase N-terminal domain-containing protein [Micromonospora sp. BRA006-A]|nr:carbamoyltransferase N-terminal domain-containing protein [Micromonospora sp. BRA006-A]
MPTPEVWCGLKLTHDGGVAAIEGNRLLFSIEAEKLENRPRHATMHEAADIVAQLAANGLAPGDLAGVAVDGWARRAGRDLGRGRRRRRHAAPGRGGRLPRRAGRRPVADRGDRQRAAARAPTPFRSFSHATDHALSSYCTSPFAARRQRALITVWDGGMVPCLYVFDPERVSLECLGPVGSISGALFPIFCSHFAPFKIDHGTRRANDPGPGLEALLPIAGKAMAYAALDTVSEEAVAVMAAVTEEIGLVDAAIPAYLWSRRVLTRTAPLGLSDAALVGSIQEFLFRPRGRARRPAVPAAGPGRPADLPVRRLRAQHQVERRAAGERPVRRRLGAAVPQRQRPRSARPAPRWCAAPAGPTWSGRCSPGPACATSASRRPGGRRSPARSRNWPRSWRCTGNRSWSSAAAPSWARARWATAASSRRPPRRR